MEIHPRFEEYTSHYVVRNVHTYYGFWSVLYLSIHCTSTSPQYFG